MYLINDERHRTIAVFYDGEHAMTFIRHLARHTMRNWNLCFIHRVKRVHI